MGTLPTPQVNLESEEIRKSFKELKARNEPKTFTFKIVRPYPFDRTIIAIPFPKNFEIPMFENFRGKGGLVTHVKELYMYC